MKILMLAVALLAAAGMSVEAAELTAKEKAVIMKVVKDQLKDPDSAKFKWGDISKSFTNKTYVDYCLLVDSKSAQGRYHGFRPYMVGLFWNDKEGFSASVIAGPNPKYPEEIYRLCEEDGYVFNKPD